MWGMWGMWVGEVKPGKSWLKTLNFVPALSREHFYHDEPGSFSLCVFAACVFSNICARRWDFDMEQLRPLQVWSCMCKAAGILVHVRHWPVLRLWSLSWIWTLARKPWRCASCKWREENADRAGRKARCCWEEPQHWEQWAQGQGEPEFAELSREQEEVGWCQRAWY